MANLKSLAKDTAIYGMSSIVGRFLNYLLVPLYTAKLSAESGGYGVITNVYAYTALLLVVLTYGMETTFFRFANKEGEDPQRVYSTILLSVGSTSLAFVALVLAFLGPISSFMGYAAHPSYVWVMAVTVAIDAFQCIPFAYLRHKKRPLKFAALKLLFIVMNIALNLFCFVALPELTGRPTDVGYAFYINLACTASITFCFWRELTGFRYVFDRALMRRMLSYSWPVLVLGVAYKADIDDCRESPAIRVINVLRKKGAEVLFYDPLVREYRDKGTVYSGQPSLTEELLEGVDITVITTAHSCVDYDFVQQHSLIVFDTRNAMRDAKDRSNIVLL